MLPPCVYRFCHAVCDIYAMTPKLTLRVSTAIEAGGIYSTVKVRVNARLCDRFLKARLLHNQEAAIAEKGGCRNIPPRSFLARAEIFPCTCRLVLAPSWSWRNVEQWPFRKSISRLYVCPNFAVYSRDCTARAAAAAAEVVSHLREKQSCCMFRFSILLAHKTAVSCSSDGCPCV